LVMIIPSSPTELYQQASAVTLPSVRSGLLQAQVVQFAERNAIVAQNGVYRR
jgi:hypothetical protein